MQQYELRPRYELLAVDDTGPAEHVFGMTAGGVSDVPVTGADVGYEDWADMSGMQPHNPLVGGQGGHPGYGSRAVAIADPAAAAPHAQVARAHWTELFNFKGNPIGWVALAAVLYLGLMHIHVRAGGTVGVGK